MGRKLGRRGMAALAGTVVVAGPVAAACASGPNYDEWAATDGAAGRINLDAVQAAFKKSKDASAFERSVNEIYEGDGIVLIRARKDGEKLTVEAFEDLNANGVIDDSSDDKLFSIGNDQGNNEMKGHGANGYYRSSFGGGNFLFTYLILSSLGPRGYGYQTPRGNYNTMRRQRNGYRGSSRYRSQVSKNTNYFSKQKSFAGSRYANAGRNLSTSRQSYLSTQKRTSAFKTTSRTGVRSAWGSKSSGSSFGKSGGGFRGYGGAQGIIGTLSSRKR